MEIDGKNVAFLRRIVSFYFSSNLGGIFCLSAKTNEFEAPKGGWKEEEGIRGEGGKEG